MIRLPQSFDDYDSGDATPKFSPGELVEHVRYGYRGVVVEADAVCQADPSWYQSNNTQPDRHQAWYHVLVHDSQSCTYAAQDSLRAAPVSQPVRHPLLTMFFSGFDGDRHQRNETPWPG